MRNLSIFKYQMRNAFYGMGSFYAMMIIFFVFGVGVLVITTSDSSGSRELNYTLDMGGFILAAILGSVSFSEDYKMFMQNGFTRKSIYGVSVMTYVSLSTIITLINYLFVEVFNSGGFTNVLSTMYGDSFMLYMLIFAMNLMFIFAANIICTMYLRLGKLKASVVLIATGLLLMVLPQVYTVLPEEIKANVAQFFLTAVGADLSKEEAVFNPVNLTLSCLVVTVVTVGISFIFVRKSELN